MAGPGSYNIHTGRLTAGSPTAITRFRKEHDLPTKPPWGTCSMLPSRELTYPPKMAFWRWFPFPKVGYVNSLEGNLPGCKLQRSKLHLRPKKLDLPGDDSMAGAALAGEVDTEYGVPWWSSKAKKRVEFNRGWGENANKPYRFAPENIGGPLENWKPFFFRGNMFSLWDFFVVSWTNTLKILGDFWIWNLKWSSFLNLKSTI